jgi:hypothetical protein
MSKQQSKYFGDVMMETVFSVGSITRPYNEDPRPPELIIESFEMAELND